MYKGWDEEADLQDLINDEEEEDDFEDVGPASDLPVTYPIGVKVHIFGIDDDFDDDQDDELDDNFWGDEDYEEPESMR